MASYNVAYSFAHTLLGEGRSFSKNNQTITLRLKSTADTSGQRARTFVVQLQELTVLGWRTRGTASFPRNGSDVASWSGLSSGIYRLRFEKSTDNIQVRGAGVISNA